MAQETYTKQDVKDIVEAAVRAAISESKKLNPIEQKQLDDQLAAEERRKAMMKALGEAEEQTLRRKKYGCSHHRNDKGESVAPGSPGAIPTTQGQVHGDDTITLICMRCSTTWRWKATAAERDYAINAEHGLLGFAPPPEERLIKTA